MAYVLKSELSTALFSQTEAENAFFTWWDKTKQMVTFGLLLLGMVAYPTTIFTNMQLTCDRCVTETANCQFMKGRSDFNCSKKDNDPGYRGGWVNRYCTMTEVDDVTLYFPYILLAISLFMVGIEKGFDRTCQTGLEKFYHTLAKEVILAGEQPDKGEHCPVVVKKRKDIIELTQFNKKRKSFFTAYLLKTIFGTILGVGLLFYCCMRGLPKSIEYAIYNERMFGCNVYGTSYECAGAPTMFYLVLVGIAIVYLAVYSFCCFYGLLFLYLPSFNKLWAFLDSYNNAKGSTERFQTDLVENNNDDSDSQKQDAKEAWDQLNNYYYQQKDLRLLLNLLAETSGAFIPLRILALFDEKIHKLFEVRQIRVTIKKSEQKQDDHTQTKEDDLKGYELVLSFKRPLATNGMLKRMKRFMDVDCEYLTEIFPSIPTLQKSTKLRKNVELGEKMEDVIKIPLTNEKVSLKTFDIVTHSFEELKAENKKKREAGKEENTKTRTIRINTIVGGKALSYQTAQIGPLQRKIATVNEDQLRPIQNINPDDMKKRMTKNLMAELNTRRVIDE